MSGQRKTTVTAAQTFFHVFVSGTDIHDEVRTAAVHVKNASVDYCVAHGIEPKHVTVNLQSALPEKNGHRLTYVMAHRAVYE